MRTTDKARHKVESSPSKVPVSKRALEQRINRKLRSDGRDEILKRTRERGRGRSDLGEYYILNTRINGIAGSHIDLEEYGRELGILAQHECLDTED